MRYLVCEPQSLAKTARAQTEHRSSPRPPRNLPRQLDERRPGEVRIRPRPQTRPTNGYPLLFADPLLRGGSTCASPMINNGTKEGYGGRRSPRYSIRVDDILVGLFSCQFPNLDLYTGREISKAETESGRKDNPLTHRDRVVVKQIRHDEYRRSSRIDGMNPAARYQYGETSVLPEP